MQIPTLKESDIHGAVLINRGKVRDIYDAGENLLFVTTDRISAFDVIMNEPIPGKGIVLTQISKFWFEKTRDIIPNHFLTDKIEEYPEPFRSYGNILRGRSMLVKKANALPVECIVRGYISGSAWKEYRKSGTIHGEPAPSYLEESQRLPGPIFTPSTKAESGHDENISFTKMEEIIGKEISQKLKEYSLQIYQRGVEIAEPKGIIIADTKFEFGLVDNQLILIDEVLTPDSSRFWPKETYAVGKSQPSLDKQYLRDYLETLDWDKSYPPPPLPDKIILNTSQKYQEILQILTGLTIDDVLKS